MTTQNNINFTYKILLDENNELFKLIFIIESINTDAQFRFNYSIGLYTSIDNIINKLNNFIKELEQLNYSRSNIFFNENGINTLDMSYSDNIITFNIISNSDIMEGSSEFKVNYNKKKFLIILNEIYNKLKINI